MDARPIGIFDSGVGGLTVADKLFRFLPGEDIIYFGDTARVPYGNKSRETVTRFSGEIVGFLQKFKVKLVIVACNTASSLSLETLKKAFSVPVVGVIEPGAELALTLSKKRRVGIIGTEATIASAVYKREIKSRDKGCAVFQKSCPLFVPLVENRWLNGRITRETARRYLSPLLKRDPDVIVLGCTHYPLLKGVIKKIAGRKVRLVDSSAAVADYVRAFLREKDMLNTRGRGRARFFVSDDTKSFAGLAKVFLKKKIKAKKVVL